MSQEQILQLVEHMQESSKQAILAGEQIKAMLKKPENKHLDRVVSKALNKRNQRIKIVPQGR